MRFMVDKLQTGSWGTAILRRQQHRTGVAATIVRRSADSATLFAWCVRWPAVIDALPVLLRLMMRPAATA
jgi:hypothetical protein